MSSGLSRSSRSGRRAGLSRSGGFIGIGALACVLFLDLASAEVLGVPTTIGLVLLWLVLLYAGVRLFTPHPRRVLWLPVIGFVAWLVPVLVVNLG